MKLLKKMSVAVILFVVLLGVAACSDRNSTFTGSSTSNEHQFLTDFDVLNSTLHSEMELKEGESIKTTIDIEKGSVDVLVQHENGTVAYRGDSAENGEFSIVITEAGKYTFSVTGRKAKGSVNFNKAD